MNELPIMSEVAHYSAFETLRDGREELIAEVLPDNLPMLKVFENSGLPTSRKHDFQAVHVSLRLR